jgi:hypothetical protein
MSSAGQNPGWRLVQVLRVVFDDVIRVLEVCSRYCLVVVRFAAGQGVLSDGTDGRPRSLAECGGGGCESLCGRRLGWSDSIVKAS